MDGAQANRPAWQTDELADEWPDDDERTHSTKQRTISTQATNTQRINGSLNFASMQERGSIRSTGTGRGAVGTFVVRDDEPPLQVLPQTPGKPKKGGMRTMFTPLAIEKMFEPPSPPEQTTPLTELEPGPSKPITSPLGLFTHNSTRPSIPSKLSQAFGASLIQEEEEEKEEEADADEILETDMPNIGGIGGKKPGANCLFTFAVDRQVAPGSGLDDQLQTLEQHPLAQSTPIPPSNSQLLSHPPIDPRLRLFQFQYDTYTRGHLSALVDSFAVSPQSGSSRSNDESTPLKLPHSTSEEADERGENDSFSRFRSTKRIKLTPASQLHDDGVSHRSNARPGVAAPKKDYLGESRSLMQQIKRARDFSMVSAATQNQAELSRIEEMSVVEEQDPPLQPKDTNIHLQVPSERPPSSASTSLSSSTNARGSKYSSLAIRAQAEDLMTKIKQDMKSNRRLFSERTDKSFVSEIEDEPGRSSAPSPEQMPIVRILTPRSDVDYDKENNCAPPPYAPNSSHDRPNYSLRRSGKGPSAITRSPEKANFVVHPQFIQEQIPIVMPIEIPIVTDFNNGLSPAEDRVRSPNPTFLAPPRLTTTVSTSDDLNRFVSSSSTATGTTLNGGSTGSFVKHAGAPQMVHIGPGDLPTIPDRVGKMVYDHDLMRWVKERQASHEARMANANAGKGNVDVASPSVAEGESDDPFRDIESLRDDDSSRRSLAQPPDVPQSPRSDASLDMIVDNGSETDSFVDAEDAHLSSFTFDDPASGVVQVMTGADEDEDEMGANMYHDDDTSDSDFDDLLPFVPNASELSDDLASMSLSQMQNGSLIISASLSPERGKSIAFNPQVTVTPLPSEKRPLQPPRSALKSASATPVSRIMGSRHRRSVSFSDGRKDGKIMGLTGDASHVTPSASLMPSVRTKRITDMLMDIEASEYSFPPRDSQTGRQIVPSVRLPDNDVSELSLQQQQSPSKRLFERSRSVRDIRTTTSPRKNSARANVDGTFLTECSFGVAHDRLVQVITDVQPFEPYWEELNAIDLSRRRLDSVARLKEFLPKLDALQLNGNLLAWLSGVPEGVRTLSVSNNALTGLTSFAHLPNLESLDISNNDIDSLENLRCLRHLRELRADGNRISSLSGLEELGGLVKLSLQGNELAEFDASGCQWSRLEMLNLSGNKLTSVTGLEGLNALISINLDNNSLVSLDPSPHEWVPPKNSGHHAPKNQISSTIMPKLRVLRLSGNRLRYLNAGRFPNLRTLYLDNNCLAESKIERQRLINLYRLGKLENFSARNQSGGNGRESGLHLQSADICDIKRLYLSGNPSPLPLGPSVQPCYNLIYLELAACRLTELPSNFSALAPNLRVLNLNYNFLESADDVALSLSGLRRLRKLSLVGSRMTGTKPLIRMLGAMGENLEMIDFRMNPCTLGWYLPLLVHDKDAPGALLQPSEFTTTATGRTSDGSKPSRGANAGGDAVHSHGHSQAIGTASSEIGVVAAGSHDAAVAAARFNGDAPGTSGTGSAAVVKDGPSRWEALDAEFRKGLPDAAYVGRLAYRGMVMRACPNLRVLDGVRVSEKERRKAEALLKRVLVDVKARTQMTATGQ